MYHIYWVPHPPPSSEPRRGCRRHRRSPRLNGGEATGEVVAACLPGRSPGVVGPERRRGGTRRRRRGEEGREARQGPKWFPPLDALLLVVIAVFDVIVVFVPPDPWRSAPYRLDAPSRPVASSPTRTSRPSRIRGIGPLPEMSLPRSIDAVVRSTPCCWNAATVTTPPRIGGGGWCWETYKTDRQTDGDGDSKTDVYRRFKERKTAT